MDRRHKSLSISVLRRKLIYQNRKSHFINQVAMLMGDNPYSTITSYCSDVYCSKMNSDVASTLQAKVNLVISPSKSVKATPNHQRQNAFHGHSRKL